MNKEVYIVGGSNGAGKTTFAKEFIKVVDITFLNADEIAREFDPDDTEGGKLQAGRVLFKRLEALIAEKKSFVIESTLSGLYMKKVIEKLKNEGYQVSLLYVYLDTPDLAVDRVKIRVQEGGHNIPEPDIRRRYYRSKLNFWNLYRDMVDGWQLFYNGEYTTIQVACGVKQEYTIANEEAFLIFMEGLQDVDEGKL
jgi:predicted ABC-type ATPase